MPGTMPRLSRTDALEGISAWGTADVVALLQKNGLEEACWKAVEKRQINGDELLHLTEGKLTLWKSDLTKSLIWSLWTFVEELKKCPENYVEEKELQPQLIQQLEEETTSDTGSWDTDFEDNIDNPINDNDVIEVKQVSDLNLDFLSNLKLFQENERITMEANAQGSFYSINRSDKENEVSASECTYENYNVSSDQESTYANVGYVENKSRNSSKLHSRSVMYTNDRQQKSLADKLKEQLMLIGVKPHLTKPETVYKRNKDETILHRSEPRTSFLHKNIKLKVVNRNSDVQRLHPLSLDEQSHDIDIGAVKKLPKPPATIRCFDLVANLPTTRPTDESEDEEEYEAFDKPIIEQNLENSIVRADSGQSLSSAMQNSLESVYQPTSSISHDEEVYEIYESITESPEENKHSFTNETNTKITTNPPPLPTKPPPNITLIQNYSNKIHTKTERSLEKSATLPASTNKKSSSSNAARPLPPPPDKQSYYERPWFHNLTREQANLLIEEQCTCGNSSDGYFLMRPSTSNPNNPLTLVLWCKDRVYNVPVRRRPDNRYALGSSKSNEQSFASIDEIIPFYKKENLVLYTGGVQTGSTRLSETPSK